MLYISIHALLAESDLSMETLRQVVSAFLSTLSLRRATPSNTRRLTNKIISIHALLAESDMSCAWSASIFGDFYPRSPCGERPILLPISIFIDAFLSTLSLRRATDSSYGALAGATISIHALLAESDQYSRPGSPETPYFYPRSPCGERRL